MIFLTELPEVSTICPQHFKTYHSKLQRAKSSPASAAEECSSSHRPCLFQQRAAVGVKAFLVAGGIYRGFGWYPTEAVIPKLLGTGALDEDLTHHPHGGQIQSAIQCLFLQDLKLHWLQK